MITIPSKVTQEEFIKYWFHKFFKGKQTLIMMFCLVGIATLSISKLMPSIFLYLAFLITITVPIFLFFKAKVTYKNNDVLNKPIEYTFSNEAVNLKSSFVDKEISFKNLAKIDWEKKFIMIYLDGNLALFLNQKDVTSLGKTDELLSLFQNAENLKFNEI